MDADDVVKVLAAVGDSWPAAIVLVSGIAAFIAVRALPRLKEITESLQAVLHEMKPNSGKTARDVMDRIEKKLDDHIEEDRTWKSQAEDLLTRNEGDGS